jgi:hypothetical protein
MRASMTHRTLSLVTVGLFLVCAQSLRADAKPAPVELPILIVADEVPAMETLARQLAERAHAKATIVNSKKEPLPEALAPFQSVLVYIHGGLAEPVEKALLAYAEGGGNLILLHHSISSGKRKNAGWFPALGVTLPEGEFASGGYKYFDDATWDLVALAPHHPILKGVKFPRTVSYAAGKKLPALPLDGTEIYLNHVLAGPRTVLLGLRWEEPQSGKLYTQDTAAWVKPLGQGQVSYFMPGHKATDFERPDYAQMLANALTYREKRAKK